jgi:putative DNA primase/helicase
MSTDEALALLTDLYCDFPTEDVSGFVAYLLTLVARNVINGPTPLYNFDGNRIGCGKGLSVDIGSILVEGMRASPYPGFPDNTEMTKHLMASARAGIPLISFDNVDCEFKGAAIGAAITTGSLTARQLGVTKTLTVDLKNVWAATGNGMTLSRDMSRRTITIHIDSNDPMPHLRTGFKYPDLLCYVRDNRPRLYMAALSVVANHLKAGAPMHSCPPMGSFGEWDRIIRAAIINAGMDDPYSIEVEQYEDPIINQLHQAWVFTSPTSVKDVVTYAGNFPDCKMADLLRPHERKNHWLGQLLRKSAGLIVDGHVLTSDGKQKAKWHLEVA